MAVSRFRTRVNVLASLNNDSAFAGWSCTLDVGAKQPWDVQELEHAPCAKGNENIGIRDRRTVPLGLIGAGRWGTNLLRVGQSMPGAAVCAVADPHPRPVHGAGVARFHDVSSLLSHPALLGVLIASPSPLHLEHALMALEAGHHVFVEKPLTLRARDAEQLCQLAESRKRTLMVGHILRYHPAVQILAALVEGGELGRPVGFSSGRMVARSSGEDPWWCLAPHDLSLAGGLLGPLSAVRCSTGGGVLRAQVRTSEGVEGDLAVGFAGHRRSWTTLRFELGEATFDPTRSHVMLSVAGRVLTLPIPPEEPLALELQHFVGCIRSGEAPLTDGQEGLRVVRALEAGERSRMTAGRWHDVV